MCQLKSAMAVPERTHAARQRRYRRRQQTREVVLTLTLSEAEVAKLHLLQCLDLDKLENRGAITEAIHLLLATIHED
jgi:hypothetical protein